MKLLIATSLGVLFLAGCTRQEAETSTAPAVVTSPAQNGSEPPIATDSTSPSTVNNDNLDQGTWSGQIAVGQPVSMFNYVGAESGDFAPMRFRNDSEAGKKILAACPDGQMCEFTGVVEWLDEPPPPDASAVGQIVRVDSVKRGTSEEP